MKSQRYDRSKLLKIMLLVFVVCVSFAVLSNRSTRVQDAKRVEHEIYLLNRAHLIFYECPVSLARFPPTVSEDQLDFTEVEIWDHDLWSQGGPYYATTGYFPFRLFYRRYWNTIKKGERPKITWLDCMDQENTKLRYAKNTSSGLFWTPGPDGDYDLAFEDISFETFESDDSAISCTECILTNPSISVRYDPTNGLMSNGDLVLSEIWNSRDMTWSYRNYQKPLFNRRAYNRFSRCYNEEYKFFTD